MGRGGEIKMSVWVSKPVIKMLGGMAILFGIVTLISGGSALFVLHGIAEPAAKIVPFVLYFNFAAGFAYIVTGAGLITLRPWSPAFSAAIALATSVVFAGLGAWILAGNAYEVRTIVAMSLRAAFWWSVSAVSIVGSRAWVALQTERNGLSSGHSIHYDQPDIRQANDNQTADE